MLLASLRLAFLLATLVASVQVAAAPRFWTLTGVRFDDGTVATGYFSYDDATRTIWNWNVHVDSFFGGRFPAFTYVPGNSYEPWEISTNPHLLYAPMGVFGTSFFEERQLQITPLAALDGSSATVSFFLREDFPSLGPPQPRGRSIAAGSLTLTPVPPPVVIVQVDEFYNTALRHYFMTADTAEKQALDTGVHPGWQRTGESFKAHAKGSIAGIFVNPVCRFYSPAIYQGWDEGYYPGADSHFFSADASECLTVVQKWWYSWHWEGDNVFQIELPEHGTSGVACRAGTIPVYRLWNQRTDSNHRYTTSAAIKAQMLAAGFLSEGYGPDGVVMCAVQ